MRLSNGALVFFSRLDAVVRWGKRKTARGRDNKAGNRSFNDKPTIICNTNHSRIERRWILSVTEKGTFDTSSAGPEAWN
jgi:hypothetical protein